MGVKATIKQFALNCPPTMGEGDIDPSTLWNWFTKCENFLRHKNVTGLDMVKTVAYRMGGVRTICWLMAKGPILEDMDWDSYKTQMHALFLQSDWEHTTCMEILRMQQPSSKPFFDFALEVMGKNNLAGTDSFMNDDYMHKTLEATMEQELSQECNCKNTPQLSDFQEWLDVIRCIDKHCCAHLEELTREIVKMNIHPAPTTRTPFQRLPTSNSTSTPLTNQTTPMPKLLQEERQLLSENGSCYKCHHFWVNHVAARCTTPPLNGMSYKMLTATDVPPRPSSFSAHGGSSRSAVAAVLANANASVASSVDESSNARIEDIHNANIVAAVLPHVASCIIDTNSPDYSDDEYTPFACPNLFWSCSLPSPSRVPLSVKGLIDDGSSIVLIKQSIVERLKLRTFTMSTPFACSSAFSGDSQHHSLATYVKICPASLDGSFSSVPLCAFVAPALVMDIILSLPFLQTNHLILDHGLGTCTTKLDNNHVYDLLHPASLLKTSPEPLWKSRHTKVSKVRAACHCNCPLVKDVLLGEEMVLKLEKRLMKGEYCNLFPDDIPPVHCLPDQIFHRFWLKDRNKIVSCRKYTCPKK
ncbi:hypothetical protein BDN71DRAFT_1392671, partial [Pleurotus eryngii]